MNTDYRTTWLRAEQEIRKLEEQLSTTRQALTDIELATRAGAALSHIGWVARRALAATGGDTAEPCHSCGNPKGDTPTEHVDERGPGWKCKCGWWNWLDAGGDTKEPA